MKVVELIQDMGDICERLRTEANRIRFVPTMGALHAGHASLIERAIAGGIDEQSGEAMGNHFHTGLAEQASLGNVSTISSHRSRPADRVVLVVSIFVNPRQFNNPDDFVNYPQTLDADLELCERLGVAYVFAPSASQMYPSGPTSEPLKRKKSASLCLVSPPECLANDLEGKSRPGHFEGVLTIVCKLFNIIRPHEAYFGEKDYQQLLLVSKMARDLNMKVNVIPVMTARDTDMLPLSSRNVRLNRKQRQVAPIIYKILFDAKQALEGETNFGKGRDISAIITASMLTTLSIDLDADECDMVDVDYLELRCAYDMSHIYQDSEVNGFDCQKTCVKTQLSSGGCKTLKTRLLISIVIGGIRLLDNIAVCLNH